VLLTAGSASAGDMLNFKSRHYDISTDLDRDLAKQVADHMDLVFAEYTRRFSQFRPRAAARNPLVVFRTQADYLQFLAKQGIDGTGSGGMFFVQAGGSALVTFLEGQSLDRMFHTLRHEGFHQFAFARIGPDLPVWANEGLAEYFAETVVLKRGLSAGQVPANRLAVMKAAIEAGQHIPLATLLTMSDETWGQQVREGAGSLQYDQSWSVVHFLVHGDKKYQRAFEAYLKLIAAGTDPAEAARRIFGASTDAFEQAWKSYLTELPEATATN
jgi:hypothetical protein